MDLSVNKIITYLLYLVKTVEKYLLRAINRMGGHSYSSLDELIAAQNTTESTEPPVEPPAGE